jgi:Lrp/AsnC family transcriptional regulator for asnA, asnC and gidA
MIDDLDLKLLEELRDNGRAAYADLAAMTGVNKATVSRRIKRLVAQNVIKFSAVSDPLKLGFTVRAMIALEVELAKIDKVCQQLVAYQCVHLVLTTFGRFHVFVLVHFPDEGLLKDFIVKDLSKLDGVRQIETFSVSEVHKGWRV